jgi:tripartite-type tricarboxylate transporter receptor subunit TctC
LNYARHSFLYYWLTVLLVLTVPASAEAECPELAGQTIRWIVPNRPGGGYDAYSRLLQPFLEQSLDARVRIENRPEAGGLVGAMAIRDAKADGRTLGLVNASGLLAASLLESSSTPDPAVDFTVLGRITRNHVVMFSGRDAGFSTIDDVLAVAADRPLVVAVRDAGSGSLMAVPIMAELLAMDYELVSGYVGSNARTLALIRGEVDIAISHFDSVQGQVRAGELVPLLQLTAMAGGEFQSGSPYANLPELGGAGGLAERRAALTGLEPVRARQAADDLDAIIGAGRLMVGPRRLPAELSACLQSRIGDIVLSEAFEQAAEQARLGIDYADSAAAEAEILKGRRALERFQTTIRAAIEQVRR